MRRCDCRAGGPRRRVRLADGCLLVFLAVLLAQSAYSLFSAGSAKTEGIDIIVRTSAAGVFGHLLSGGGRCPQEPRDPAEGRALRFRALAAAAIGIFCLFTLLAYRAVLLHRPGFAAPDSAAATVAQFRDFVSGCIGCLIGSPSVAASATVYGTVTDGTNPLPNATVKLFDSLGVPYRHVMTDVAGAYSFDNVPAGTYSIAAALDGYIMSPSSLLTLSSGSSIEVPLVCRSEAALALGAIAGTATTIGLAGSAPVAGATVTLRNLAGTAVATTRTADDGEFVFYDVADGIYSLVATADGYLATAPIAVTIAEGSIANVAVNMVVDSRTYNGTVSGIIRDSNGAPVSGPAFLKAGEILKFRAANKTRPRSGRLSVQGERRVSTARRSVSGPPVLPGKMT